MRHGPRSAVVAIVIAAGAAVGGSGSAGTAEESRGKGAVAVIVHASNPCPNPTLLELRDILTLRQQFWKDGKRVTLILPASGSREKCVLQKTVYRSNDDRLRRDWAQRLFTGEIPAVPSSLRSPEARIGAVKHSAGAISVVPAADVTPDVRVLIIDGKRPGEAGYPLEDGC
jgi:hypothetical protein